MTKLTAKQEMFCREYLVDLNGTEAAKRAGYAHRSAGQIAGENMKKPEILERIAALKAERVERVVADADYLLKRLLAEAEADLADLYTEQGSLKPVHQWPKIWRQGLVAGLEVQQQYEYVDGEKVPDGVVVKARLADRVKRLELLGKHIDVGAFAEKHQHEHEHKGEIGVNTNQIAGDVYREIVERERSRRTTH